jgi:hypothetical protein
MSNNNKHPPGDPMTLNDACRHVGLIGVSKYPGDAEVPWFARKVVCNECRRAWSPHRRAAQLERAFKRRPASSLVVHFGRREFAVHFGRANSPLRVKYGHAVTTAGAAHHRVFDALNHSCYGFD